MGLSPSLPKYNLRNVSQTLPARKTRKPPHQVLQADIACQTGALTPSSKTATHSCGVGPPFPRTQYYKTNIEGRGYN